MTPPKLFGTGLAGTAVFAVCCFTPALVILLGAVGLSAWLAWLDYVLIPGLVLFAGLTLFGLTLWLRQRRAADATPEP